MKNLEKRIDADLIVSGGGIPGICTAIQAARLGLKVALINNRTRFGGNGSAELMINISGAAGMQEFNFHARETGVIEELWLENLYKNPNNNRWLWDSVVLDKLLKEPNISLFANTCIDEVVMEDSRTIRCVCGTQNTTETRYRFYAPLFVDDTGDGTVAYLAGAEYRYGREAKAEFNERIAPDEADNHVLPSTMVFFSERRDHPVRYVAPDFALDLTKTDVFQYRVIPKGGFHQFVWFYEIDGKPDQVYEAEDINLHHKQLVYGIWDYIKNSGKFDADCHELSYVSPIMGKRESRRIVGAYMLKEQDVVEQQDFDDAVGHGGWSIDLHAIDGFFAKEPINRHIFLKGIYQIPYRCGYSKDIGNLFIEGRCMSATHVAFGSTRVMATLATIGQANAVAAWLCKKYGCSPHDIYLSHREELQQKLLELDQYIVGKRYADEKNLAAQARVTVSSVREPGYTKGTDEVVLDTDYSITLPVRSRFGGIRLFAKAEADTDLRYSVYKPSKPENYDLGTKILEGSAAVSAGAEFSPVLLQAELEVEPGFYVVRLHANSAVTLRCAQLQLTEAITSQQIPVNAVNYIDLETLEPKSQKWKMLNMSICFELPAQENILDGSNLINGYARPYRLPNVWQAEGVENEYAALDWEKAVSVNEITVILDSYLNEYLRGERERREVARPMLVKDYDVEIKRPDGSYEVIKQIRDNYQRINTVRFERTETTGIRLRFLATNGQPHVSVYEIRVYDREA